MSSKLKKFIEEVPKADVHAHSTGFIPLQMAFEAQLAPGARTAEVLGRQVSSAADLRQLQKDYVHDLNSYLDFYKLFKRPFEDLSNLDDIYLAGMKSYQDQNAVIVEVRASINSLENADNNGIAVAYTPEQEIETLISAIEKAKAETGVAVALTLCVRRGKDKADLQRARQLFELARAYRRTDTDFGVSSLDLVGKEMGNHAVTFRDVFSQAIDEGLGVTIHAGEAVFQASIGQAISECGAHRIGHGVASRRGKTAYNLIRNRRVLLEICPTSNVITGAVKCIDPDARKGQKDAYRSIQSIEDHPVGEFVRDGLRVTICTDGQTTVGTTITEELTKTALAHGWDEAMVAKIIENGMIESFCRDDERDQARKKLKAFVDTSTEAK